MPPSCGAQAALQNVWKQQTLPVAFKRVDGQVKSGETPKKPHPLSEWSFGITRLQEQPQFEAEASRVAGL
jgi:hypothetical protein